MNRKLLVIAMVPLLVGFAGATAFSMWSGAIVKQIDVSTATVQVTEEVYLCGYWIEPGTQVTLSQSVNGISVPFPTGFSPNLHGSVPSSCPSSPSSTGTSDDGCHAKEATCTLLATIPFLGGGVTSVPLYVLQAGGQVGGQDLSLGSWLQLDFYEQVTLIGASAVDLISTLIPFDQGLAATIDGVSPGYVSYLPTSTGYAAAPDSGWTYFAPIGPSIPTSNCADVGGVSPTPGPLTVGTGTTSDQVGLAYCDEGPLGGWAPGIPAAPGGKALPGSPVIPGGGPLTPTQSPIAPTGSAVFTASGTTYTCLLFGLSEDAYYLPVGSGPGAGAGNGMGLVGSIGYVAQAYGG